MKLTLAHGVIFCSDSPTLTYIEVDGGGDEMGTGFGADARSGRREAEARRDARLVRSIVRTGSRAKADALVRAYYDEVLRFVQGYVMLEEDARDVTQDIFVAALRGLPGFDARRASFRTWLYRIAANKSIDWLRAARRSAASLDETPMDIADARDELADLMDAEADAALAARVGEYLLHQPNNVRRIVCLRACGGRSFPEIARALNEPESAVKTRYYRAVHEIRAQVEREERMREVRQR